MEIETLFEQHLGARLLDLEDALDKFELEGLLLGAGAECHYYQDDQETPFRTSHHFRHYCPVEGEGHALVLRPGNRPLLFYYCPRDFWYEHKPLGEPYWHGCFEIRVFETKEALWEALAEHQSLAYLGPEDGKALEFGLKAAPQAFEHHLNWFRAYKSPYEVHCLEQATQIAANGHVAARAAFLQGGSEYDIHMAYLSVTRLQDYDLPYTAIVGLDEKAAILHYPGKRRQPRDGKVLLIDSGASYAGYASDITRTHATGDVAEEFLSMLVSMNDEQQSLCGSIRAGMNFGELFHASHLAVGRVLLEHGILKGIGLSEAVEEGLTHVFYPHGVSHMLGILVHDVGSKQLDTAGNFYVKDEERSTKTVMRDIEEGHLFTVEPGLYFMEMLLNPQREGQHKDRFNWGLIDRLMPLGGIRIEDNLYIGADGVRNLTRQYLPD